MATNFTLLRRGLLQLAILLLLFIISPILLSMAFKAIRIYEEGLPFILSIVFLVLSGLLMLFTILYAFKAFKTILRSLFQDS